MKKLFLAGLAMTALITSCSDDLGTQGNNLQTATLTATAATTDTRVAFDEKGEFYWSADDKLGILTENSSKFTPFSLTDGAGKSSASFTGTTSSNKFTYAVYPYNDDHSVSGTTLTFNYPAEYTYTKVDQTYFPESKDGNSFNPAMWGKVTDNNSVSLKHLGGVFCIKIDKMPCASGKLEVSQDANMAGKFTANLSETDPVCANTQSTVVDGSKKVTINFSGATVNQPGVFYVPVPTGQYNDVRVKFFEGSTEKVNTIAGNYTVARKGAWQIELGESTITADQQVEVTDATEAAKSLETSNNVAITGEVASGTTVTIPAASTTSSTTKASKTLTLQKVADGATLTVNEADGTTATTGNNLTISMPNPTSGKEASLNINTPNSTTTIAANAGTTTIKELTAETAENTLIVSSGVTINKLTVKKGNVRINKGATVTEVILASDASTTAAKVFYEEGAKAPTTLGEGVTAIQIPVGAKIISTAAQFVVALQTGGNYALVNDVTCATTSATYTKATVNIDLNQKTLTVNGDIYSWFNGNLTFTNGNIVQAKDMSLVVDSNGALTLNKVNYTGNGGYSCVFVKQNSHDTSVTIKNSNLTINEGYYAVTTNASTDPTVASNCTITLENSTFKSGHSSYGGTALLVNIPATVKMKDCSFTSYCQAALLRGGTYEIENCSFTLDAKFDSSDTGNKWLQAWKSGNECAYAALTIGNYQNSAYQYPTKVTFTATDASKKSKAEVTGTNASIYPAMHVCANADTDKGVTITGLSNITLTQTKEGPKPEYGTTNITVDGTAVTANVSSK